MTVKSLKFLYVFGEYVQAHDEPTRNNTNVALSFDYIFLRLISSARGVHEQWQLITNSVIMH